MEITARTYSERKEIKVEVKTGKLGKQYLCRNQLDPDKAMDQRN